MHRLRTLLLRAGLATATLPIAVATGVLWVIGRRDAAADLDRKLVERCLGPGPSRRVPLRGLLGIPSWALAMYLVLILVLNLAYPLRPDSDDLSNAWGGPSMAGAWIVHAVGAVAFVLLIGIPILAVLGTAMAGLAGRTAGSPQQA